MKIYIEEFNISNININNKFLNDFLVTTKLYDELYSSQGIYRIENAKTLRKLEIYDNELIYLKNYVNEHSIILDKTIIKKSQLQLMHIPNDIIVYNKLVKMYRLRDKSPIIMIIEIDCITNCVCDLYFQLNESYAAYSEADMNNEFIKNDLISFINLLS